MRDVPVVGRRQIEIARLESPSPSSSPSSSPSPIDDGQVVQVYQDNNDSNSLRISSHQRNKESAMRRIYTCPAKNAMSPLLDWP